MSNYGKEVKEKMARNEQAIKKNPLFEVRYSPTHVPLAMALFDDKEANIRISDREELVPSLWRIIPMS